MSAALESLGPAAAADMERVQHARDANAGWEQSHAVQAARSERRAWRVAGICVVVTVFAIAAVFVQGPLRRIEVVPIVVDKLTGETTVATKLDIQTIPAEDALDMHNAEAFIHCREGYIWQFLQRDYDCVRRMATQPVFADYNKQFDGPEALDKRLGSQGEQRINIVSIRLPPTGRQGNVGEVIVTFDKELRLPNKPTPEVQRYVSTLRFEYQPQFLQNERDRTANPFGFLVTAYRANAEFIGPTQVPTAAQE